MDKLKSVQKTDITDGYKAIPVEPRYGYPGITKKIVVEQVDKHEKSIAFKSDLPHAVKQAVVQALLNEDNIARTLLKDPQVMASYV
ncbi:MAG: hypothetical protein ACRCT4_00280 [Silvania sp.]